VGIFGRKRRGRHAAPERGSFVEEPEVEEELEGLEATEGPFDVVDAPDDGMPRIDLGSVQVPVPDGTQVQVEMDPATGGVRAVHVMTPHGQVTVSAYAAPRSGGLWQEVGEELTEQLRADGARVSPGDGEWGFEISALLGDVALRFVGVDGPRWMLRGVIAGPQSQAAEAPRVLRDIVRGTVVVRGEAPMPVRTPLPITLPAAVAQHVAEQQAGQTQQQRA
jgi:uncharacterized protein DUF3710